MNKKKDEITWENAMTLQRYLLHCFENEPIENVKKLVACLTPRQRENARMLYREWKKKRGEGK